MALALSGSAIRLNQAAAIWDRPALCTQANSTVRNGRAGRVSGTRGTTQLNNKVAVNAPAICDKMKPGTSAGRMPATLSVNARATVTAGLANEVEAVNQNAAPMYAATAKGTAEGRRREHPQMTASSPKVATNSLNNCAGPLRSWSDASRIGSPNITCAVQTPIMAPAIWTSTYAGTSRHPSPPSEASAAVTAGLKWAPDTEPRARMRAASAPAVATNSRAA